MQITLARENTESLSTPSSSPRLLPSLNSIFKVAACVFASLPTANFNSLIKVQDREFPYPVARMCATHEIPSSDGSSHCRIDDSKISFSDCEDYISDLKKKLQKQMPEMLQTLDSRLSPSTGMPLASEQGFLFGYPDTIIGLGANPNRFANCQKAYNYIQAEILNDVDYFKKSEEEVLNSILKSHELIADHMPLDHFPGEFRRLNLLVMDEEIERNYQGIHGELKNRGGTPKELKKIKSIFNKIMKDEKLTESEREIFRKISPAAIDYTEIPSEMKIFVRELKKKMLLIEEGSPTNEDVIEIAAWVHQEIIRIHPFSDANGRVARLWLNTVLEMGGISSVLFPVESKYLSNTDADLRGESGAFCKYLKEIIKENKSIQNRLLA